MKHKKILSILLSALLLSSVLTTGIYGIGSFSFSAYAEDIIHEEKGLCGENAKYTISSDGVLTISPVDLSIGYASVDAGFFRVRDYIKEVILEEGLTDFGDHVFSNCSSLRSIVFPHSTRNIGWGIIFGSDNIKEVTILDGMEELNIACLSGWYVEKISLPKSITKLTCEETGQNPDIFIRSNLRDIEIDEDNPAYYSSYTLAKGCRVYEKGTDEFIVGAIYGAAPIEKIPEGTCGENAKYVYDNGLLTISPIDSQLGRATVYTRIFEDQVKITDIVIEEGITEISSGAFMSCENVRTLSLPDSLVAFEKGSIEFMDLLESLHIPANLTDFDPVSEFIGWSDRHGSKFKYTTLLKLKRITVDPKNPKFDSRENCNALIETATDTLCITSEKTFVPESIKHIGNNAFACRYNMKSLTLPEGLESIGEDAFSCCIKLENIDLPESLESIGTGAFDFCVSLEKVSLPSKVTEIKESTFIQCFSLKKVDLSENLEFIGKEAFVGCVNLEEIDFGDKLKEIGAEAFFITGLKKVVLPESLEKIGSKAFANANTKEVICKSKNLEIDDYAYGYTPFVPEYCDYATNLCLDLYKKLGEISKKYPEIIIGDEIIEDPELLQKAEAEYKELESLDDGTEKYIVRDEETDNPVMFVLPDFTIASYMDSTSHTFALENGMNFTSCPLGEHTNIQVNTEGYPATCTSVGFEGGSACLDCETIIEKPIVIPAKGHKLVTAPAVKATCTVSGLTEGEYCSVCGFETISQSVIIPTGHIDTDGDNHCDVCGEETGSETEIEIAFIERIKNFFANIFDKLFNIFKKYFGK